MADCELCDVATRDVHGRIVHETRETLAFLAAEQLAVGHVVVAPKDHYRRLGDLPGDQAADLFRAVHELAPRVEAAVEADGITVAVADGEAAGQDVMHLHVNLIPRVEGDGGGPIHAAFDARPALADDELDAVAGAIRSGLAGSDPG
jgi:histidine triad (HIT) family protein